MGKPVVRSSLDPTTGVTEKRRSDRLPVTRASNGVEQAQDTASQLQMRGREGKEPSGRVRQGQSTVEFCGESLGADVGPSHDLVRTALSSQTTVNDLARRSMAVLQMPSHETGRSRCVTRRIRRAKGDPRRAHKTKPSDSNRFTLARRPSRMQRGRRRSRISPASS